MFYEEMAIRQFGKERGMVMAAEALEKAHVVAHLEPGRYRRHIDWWRDIAAPELFIQMEQITDVK